jgi:probable rRNA maturation factor
MVTGLETVSIDFLVESPLWSTAPAAEPAMRHALNEAATMMSTSRAELAIVLTDDSGISALNRRWRGIDEPTNVLAFPAVQHGLRASEAEARRSAGPTHLGDIVVAFETAMQEAREESKRFEDHLAHLVVHGFLHLLGQDHGSDSEAEAMERLERAILARLGIPDPYLARDLDSTADCDA